MALLSGLSLGKTTSAFKATGVFDAVLKGYGSKSLSKILQNLSGGLIPTFSFTLPIININIGVLDLARYYLHTGGTLKPTVPALIATLLPLLFPNPGGPLIAVQQSGLIGPRSVWGG